jgi:hypothetical protein
MYNYNKNIYKIIIKKKKKTTYDEGGGLEGIAADEGEGHVEGSAALVGEHGDGLVLPVVVQVGRHARHEHLLLARLRVLELSHRLAVCSWWWWWWWRIHETHANKEQRKQ